MACHFGAFSDMEIRNPPIFKTIWIILISLFSTHSLFPFCCSRQKSTFFRRLYTGWFFSPLKYKHNYISVFPVDGNGCDVSRTSDALILIKAKLRESTLWSKFKWSKSDQRTNVLREREMRKSSGWGWVNQWIFIWQRIYLSSWEIQHSKKVLI